MKACVNCGEDNLDNFEVNKVEGYKIYYRSQCRSCYNATVRKKVKATTKACVNCGEDNLDKFEVNKVEGNKIYYRSQCRSCYNDIARERVRAKLERVRAQYLQDIKNL